MSDLNERFKEFDPELVVGLVGAVGTELGEVERHLTTGLKRAGYQVHSVSISREVITLLQDVEPDGTDEYERISRLMTAGNEARCAAGDDSILALGAAFRIYDKRTKEGNLTTPSPKTAFIVSSLKRPEEVERLRTIYGTGFVLVSVHADEKRRLNSLKEKEVSEEHARVLIERDANEQREEHGQRLTQTFHLADFFVRIEENTDKLKGDLQRIVDLMFGHPYKTPSFDEYAMFFAFSAALRSADLSRQVGAVIARGEQILATGANDCPKFNGGLYWPTPDENGCLDDFPNGRDFKRGSDSNRDEQRRIIETIVAQGRNNGLNDEQLRKTLEESPITDLTEYGRVVHAEMDALLSCARSNVSTQAATLYSTTFPCHNCAKHIIAAGITRVVYVEPYEKSKAPQFHGDSVCFGFDQINEKKVRFEPFVGIGPRRFFDLFSMRLSSGYDLDRKTQEGKCVEWKLSSARLRLRMLPSSYLELESDACDVFRRTLSQGGN